MKTVEPVNNPFIKSALTFESGFFCIGTQIFQFWIIKKHTFYKQKSEEIMTIRKIKEFFNVDISGVDSEKKRILEIGTDLGYLTKDDILKIIKPETTVSRAEQILRTRRLQAK